MKTFALLNGERSRSCYLFEDREILVVYDDNTYSTIPVALLVIEAGDNWENLVYNSSSIRY